MKTLYLVVVTISLSALVVTPTYGQQKKKAGVIKKEVLASVETAGSTGPKSVYIKNLTSRPIVVKYKRQSQASGASPAKEMEITIAANEKEYVGMDCVPIVFTFRCDYMIVTTILSARYQ